MKKFFASMAVVIIVTCTFAQVPQKMSYQAVIRNSGNALVTNQNVGMRISILQGSSDGPVVYTETQTPVTNSNGLVSIEIGGEPGFNAIDWSAGPFFLKTETDPTGATNFTIIGISQLLSVPFALHAKTAENGFSGNYYDLSNKPELFDGQYASLTGKPSLFDGDYNSLVSKPSFSNVSFTGSYNDLVNTPSLFDGSWLNLTGKPSTLTGYGITDAIPVSHPAYAITVTNINNWNTTYSWGDHSGLYKPVSYVPLWTEIMSKPDFATIATTGNFDDLLFRPTTLEGYGITNGISTSHAVNSITSVMINNWNSSFTWGDHSVAGYFKNGGENGGTNRLMGNMDNYSLSLITDNSSRIYIGNTGNIGIGTDAPTQKLEVAGVAQISSQVYSPFFNALPGTTHGNSVTIQAGRANGGFGSDLQSSGGSLNGGNVKIEGGSANHFGQGGNVEIIAGDAFDTNSKGGNILLKAKGYSNWTPGYIAFFTGGSYSADINKPIERMRLEGNGNLGIGTTVPAAKVDISGNIKITDGSQGVGKVLTSDANGLASWQSLSSGGFSGSGTTNYWTKWTSENSIANAMALDDGTNISIQALIHRDNPGTVTVRGGRGQSGTGHVYIYGGNYFYQGGDWQGGGNRTSGNVYVYAGKPEYGAAAGGSVIIEASAGFDSRFANGSIQLLNGNVGIGTSTPDPNAIVDMTSTTKGFLPPRMTKTQRDAIPPVAGLMIYNLSTNKPNFYDGTTWKTFDGTPID